MEFYLEQGGSWAHPVSYKVGTEVHFPELECEADHLSPSSSKVNEFIFPSIPLYMFSLHGA
jgi:hypothetical protein